MGRSGKTIEMHNPNDESLRKSFNNVNLVISKKGRNLKLSTIIRSKDGIVAKIKDNEWQVFPHRGKLDRNYNENALEVIEIDIDKDDADVIFQVRLLKDRIQVQGKFYDNNGFCTIVKGKKGVSGIIGVFGTNYHNPNIDLTIEPIFKYPSELHFGEMTQKFEDDYTIEPGIVFK
jgi:hypothetical protein